jgi:Peptidase family S41
MIDRRGVLAGAAAVGISSLTPPAASAAFDTAAVGNDIAILRRSYTLLHPGLTRYATPQSVAARFDRLEVDFARQPTLRDAYLTLSRFLATVRCGHTYANFFNQSDKIAAALFAGKDKLPFEFRWLDERMIVARNRSPDVRLVPGTEVVEIDGRAASAILRDLLPLVRADGSNDAKRRALLEVRATDRYETFDVFFGLMFPPKAGLFRLRVRPPSGAEITLHLPAIDLAERRRGLPAEAAANAPKWNLSYPTERIALLKMPDWVVYNTKWNWQAFLDTAFAEMTDRKAMGLIVDLRGNEGGNDCGNEIIARLIDRDLPLESYERRVRYRQMPRDLDAYLDTWDPSFKTLGENAIEIGDGFYRLPGVSGGDGANLIRPKGPRFNGGVIVLTDAQNSSATFQFASAMQTNRLGRLVGGPTGGNQRGINGGGFFFLRLPASGLEADLPLIGTFPRTPKPDAGLMPDIHVSASIADIAAGRDRVLETAIGLLARA